MTTETQPRGESTLAGLVHEQGMLAEQILDVMQARLKAAEEYVQWLTEQVLNLQKTVTGIVERELDREKKALGKG